MTHFLNPNDTIVFSDSIVIKMAKSTDLAMSSMNDSISNWADVKIAQWISGAIVSIVFICVAGYVILRIFDAILNSIKIYIKRKWDEADRKRSQKLELLSQKLEFLKELSYKNNKAEGAGKGLKEYRGLDSNEIKKYLSELDKALESLGVEKNERKANIAKAEKGDNSNA